jgi:hypothetical protein
MFYVHPGVYLRGIFFSKVGNNVPVIVCLKDSGSILQWNNGKRKILKKGRKKEWKKRGNKIEVNSLNNFNVNK